MTFVPLTQAYEVQSIEWQVRDTDLVPVGSSILVNVPQTLTPSSTDLAAHESASSVVLTAPSTAAHYFIICKVTFSDGIYMFSEGGFEVR